MKSNNFISVIVISVSFIISMLFISNAIINRNSSENIISVTGLAERDFESDLIVWKSRFTVKKMDLVNAYADLKKQSEMINNFLAVKGIETKSMTFSAVEISKEYSTSYNEKGNAFSVFDGYRLTQQISITSKDVEKIEKVSREITELINSGIEITSLSPQYYYTKLSNLKIEMLAEASKDALLRAQTMAQNGDAKLGKMVGSTMGVFQIVAQNSSEDYSWGGSFNTSSKNKTASVTVKVQYKVE
ncbi:MAG: SIMPL domain-containing protein [Paludibacter sp.]